MALKTIAQSIDIAAPRERVWDVLLQDETYRDWSSEFMEGSYAVTDWQPGSRVEFLDPAGSGMLGRVVVADRPAHVEVEYDGVVVEGREVTDSPEARELAGSREAYRLSERGGGTHLAVECGMGEAHYDEMSAAWVRALARVKALAEAPQA